MSGALQAKSLGWLSLKIVPLDSQCISNATSAPRCRPRLLFLYLYSVNGASSFVMNSFLIAFSNLKNISVIIFVSLPMSMDHCELKKKMIDCFICLNCFSPCQNVLSISKQIYDFPEPDMIGLES